MSHGHGTSGSISCCLRREFTILLKICRPERVGLGEFGASTEDNCWIGGKELVLELIIKKLHENYAVRNDIEQGISGFKKAAVGRPLINE